MRFFPSAAVHWPPRRRAVSSRAAAHPHVLVLNAGSSSLKYALFGLEPHGVGAAVFKGLVELSPTSSSSSSSSSSPFAHAATATAIGTRRDGRITHETLATGTREQVAMPLDSHRSALEAVVAHFFGAAVDGIRAVGHRVVHGGEAFSRASLVDPAVLNAIQQSATLAPLHNPNNLLGIQVASEVFGPCPQVAVFDTAFHATMPPKAYTYGVPRTLYEKLGVRRYGFHGTSHQYVAQKAAAMLGKSLRACNFITCHLGNGSSVAAIQNGQCIDTSMGMTPLEGLVMGTRCGDVDPALHAFLCKELGRTIEEVDAMLNKKSGLLGICGESDMRVIHDRVRDSNDVAASLALDVFAHRVRKYVGAYALELGGDVDAIIFTAGIGENSASIRERVCRNLNFLGVEINGSKNAASTMGAGPVEIQADHATTKVMVVNTDEERSIAEQTYEIALKQ